MLSEDKYYFKPIKIGHYCFVVFIVTDIHPDF
jgi:hypothetical protein